MFGQKNCSRVPKGTGDVCRLIFCGIATAKSSAFLTKRPKAGQGFLLRFLYLSVASRLALPQLLILASSTIIFLDPSLLRYVRKELCSRYRDS